MKPDRILKTNVEYYAAAVLQGVGLPPDLFPSTFALARHARSDVLRVGDAPRQLVHERLRPGPGRALSRRLGDQRQPEDADEPDRRSVVEAVLRLVRGQRPVVQGEVA